MRLQVRLAGFVNELGDFPHRGMDRQVAQPLVNDQAEKHSQKRYEQATHQQAGTANSAEKSDPAQIGNNEIDLASAMLRLRGLRKK